MTGNGTAEPSKLALIGGYGYLGANLSELVNSCIITKRSSVIKRPFLAEVFKDKEVIIVEEINKDSLREALRSCKPDVAVYLIGKITGTYEEMREAHVTLAEKAVNASIEARVPSFVYISSTASVGIAERCLVEGYVEEEESLLEGCQPIGSYSETKAMGEKTVFKYNASGEISVGIVRPPLILGGYGYRPEHKWLEISYRFKIPTFDMNYTSPECVLQGILTASKNPGWYYTVEGTLSERGYVALNLKPPIWLIKKAPDSLKPMLLAMRYRFSSRYIYC